MSRQYCVASVKILLNSSFVFRLHESRNTMNETRKSRLIQFKIVRITFARAHTLFVFFLFLFFFLIACARDWSNYSRRLCALSIRVFRVRETWKNEHCATKTRTNTQKRKTEEKSEQSSCSLEWFRRKEQQVQVGIRKKTMNRAARILWRWSCAKWENYSFSVCPGENSRTQYFRLGVTKWSNEVRSARSPRQTFTANCGRSHRSAAFRLAICARNAIELHPCALCKRK